MFDAPLPIGEADVTRCAFDDMTPVGTEKYFVYATLYETDRKKVPRHR